MSATGRPADRATDRPAGPHSRSISSCSSSGVTCTTEIRRRESSSMNFARLMPAISAPTDCETFPCAWTRAVSDFFGYRCCIRTNAPPDTPLNSPLVRSRQQK
jgi:hypothetical protein